MMLVFFLNDVRTYIIYSVDLLNYVCFLTPVNNVIINYKKYCMDDIIAGNSTWLMRIHVWQSCMIVSSWTVLCKPFLTVLFVLCCRSLLSIFPIFCIIYFLQKLKHKLFSVKALINHWSNNLTNWTSIVLLILKLNM